MLHFLSCTSLIYIFFFFSSISFSLFTFHLDEVYRHRIIGLKSAKAGRVFRDFLHFRAKEGKFTNCIVCPTGGAKLPVESGKSWYFTWQIHDILTICTKHMASQRALVVKNPPASARDIRSTVRSLGQEDPLEEGMATHSSILAWRIPWTEESDGLQSIRSQSQT